MANKLPWFTHDHDAHNDTWVRHIVRTQGHVAGWMWWVLLELHHKHGVGDSLKIDIFDVARACLTSNSVVTRVLTQMATEFEGQLKVSWTLVGTELELKIPKFRERQAKLKSKTPSRLLQPSAKTPIEREGEEERDITLEFESFYAKYPRHEARAPALKAWIKLATDKAACLAILSGLEKQLPDLLLKEKKFVPLPASWLNARRWEDEVVEDPGNPNEPGSPAWRKNLCPECSMHRGPEKQWGTHVCPPELAGNH